MKITKTKLRQLIQEALDQLDNELEAESYPGDESAVEAQFQGVADALAAYIEDRHAEGEPIHEIRRNLSSFTSAFIENY